MMGSAKKQAVADGAFIFLAIVSAILWIIAWFPWCPQWVQVVVSGPSILVAFAQYAIHRWDWAHLRWQRFLMYIRRNPVNWSLNITICTNHQDPIGAASECILRSFPGSRVWSENRGQKIIELQNVGQVARIRLRDAVSDYDETTGELEIRLSNANMHLDSAEKQFNIVNGLLSSLLSKTLAASQSRFAFEVAFNDGNPYFGLWVKRLQVSPDALISFQCVFKEQTGPEEGTIQVSAKRLQITTEDLGAWFALARKYIALSGIGAAREVTVDTIA